MQLHAEIHARSCTGAQLKPVKHWSLVLAVTGLLVACGGAEDGAEKAQKAALDQQAPKTCPAGLTLSGDQCIPEQAQAGLAAETK